MYVYMYIHIDIHMHTDHIDINMHTDRDMPTTYMYVYTQKYAYIYKT